MYASSVIGSARQEAEDERRNSVSSFVSEFKTLQHEISLIPPPKGFTSESQAESITEKPSKRNDRPPIASKPQFLTNSNMNNNNRIQAQMTSQYGTTKLKNLMLLRKPIPRKPAQRRYSSDESYDSLTDSDESCDELEETITGDESKSNDGTSSISSISTTSIERVKAAEDTGQFVIVKITVPEQKLTKCMQLEITETVWTAKQRILQSLAKKFNDPLNYGLYHEKLGTFLLDHVPMSQYIESGTVGSLQMRYKCRRMDLNAKNSKETRQIAKMQNSSKRRDFLNHVQQFATDKVYGLLRKGIDPNFQCPSTGETPLTMLASSPSRPECVPVFMALMGGGAHLDFRNNRGFTPMHVAARSGNKQMIKTLLEFNASPNVVDGRDLTPLYHCILLGSDPPAAAILIDNSSIIGCCDSQGWSEIHQACRHGRVQLLELLLSYEYVDSSMVNAQNASGNTPLHVCALYNQEMCAVILLKHGADANVTNFANQDAIQVAHVAANVSLAQLISDYPKNGEYEHPLFRMRSESVSVANGRPLVVAPKAEKDKKNIRATWTANSIVKHCQQYMFQKQHSVGSGLGKSKDTYTAIQDIENRFDSTLPPNARIPDQASTTPTPTNHTASNGNAESTEVRIVVKDYVARTPDEISLRVGSRVIVLSSRNTPPGYHDGIVGNQRGFFPQDCIEQVKLRRPHPDAGQRAASDNTGDRRNGDKNHNFFGRKQHASAEPTFNHIMPDSISIVSFASSEEGSGSPAVGRRPSGPNDDLAPVQATEVPGLYHSSRSVTLWKGDDGFGFILRGAKAEGPVKDFNPNAKYPALQYLESIEEGSNAHNAGLRSGDFIIKIGETDVRRYGHQQLVETIRACGEPLRMQVTTVIHKKSSEDTASLYSNSSSKQRKNHGKSDSISSALDQLDNILALEDSDGSDQTLTLRRVPGSRKIRTEDLQDLFARQNGSTQGSLQRSSPQQSTFSSARRPIRALPPSLASAIENRDGILSGPSDDTASLRSFSSSSSSNSSFTTWGRSSVTNNPGHNGAFKAHTISAATGAHLVQNSSKARKVPPPPPKRINSRLSVTSEEDNTKSPTLSSEVHSIPESPQPPTSPKQMDMAIAIAMAAKSRAERITVPEVNPPESKPEPQENRETSAPKSVAELSSALSIALAAKQKLLNQRKSPPSPKKPQSTSFTVNPAQSTITKTKTVQPLQTKPLFAPPKERHPLPPPPSHLPPPPPAIDVDDVTGLALPPPPSFPAPDPQSDHHTRYNHLTFDELMDLPPPPSDLLRSPSPQDPNIKPPEEFRRPEGKSKPTKLGILPPPPVPPPMDDDEDGGCVSPTGADSLSNADSGVADVAGDGLNNSHHRSLHDHIGDNHSTVSSVSTISTLSSEDGNSDFSSSHERTWPLREVRTPSNEDSKQRDSPPASPAGNMYLDILKKAKNKGGNVNSSTASNTNDSKKNLRPGITVTKMTFAPISSLPPPAEESKQTRPKTTGMVFPPAPKEYSNSGPKQNRTPAPIETKKIEFIPKAAPAAAPVVKPPEKNDIKTTHTPLVTKVASETKTSANNNPSPEKKSGGSTSGTGKKPLAQWSVQDVANWLRELQLDMYISAFEENEISGEHLPDLGKDELIELGVKRVGHRLTIDRSVKKLLNPEAS